MRIVVTAVGRLKAGPERDLFDRYMSRAASLGRSQGLGSVDLVEIEEGRHRSEAERRRKEATALRSRWPPGAVRILFDERGENLSSRAFAEKVIEGPRSGGATVVVLGIGGPDGFDPDLLEEADRRVAFGRLTIPHGLARVLVAEQLYRALTILCGHPYHRD